MSLLGVVAWVMSCFLSSVLYYMWFGLYVVWFVLWFCGGSVFYLFCWLFCVVVVMFQSFLIVWLFNILVVCDG